MKIDKLPASIDLQRLGYRSDNEDSLYDSLVRNQATYHNSCKSRYNSREFDRAIKRQSLSLPVSEPELACAV